MDAGGLGGDARAARRARLSPEKQALLARLRQGRAADGRIPRRPDPDAHAPLSFAQERIHFLEQLHPGTALHHIHAAARLTGPLDVRALEAAIAEIGSRHAILRAAFQIQGGAPACVMDAGRAPALAVVDLTDRPEAGREAEALARAASDILAPFDLGRGPLARCTLYRLREREHALLVVVHHLVADGWSLGVFARELAALYEARLEGRQSPLGELPIQYPDFAAWQRAHRDEARLAPDLAFWRDRLAGSGVLLELPTDRPRPPRQSFAAATHRAALPASLVRALRTLGQGEDATLFMTLLAGLYAALHRHSGAQDIVVGSPVAGRLAAEAEPLIGVFINTLALRAEVTGEASFRDLLRRARETALSAMAHQDLPFERLVEELHPARDLSRPPLFQVLFTLQSAPTLGITLSGITSAPMTVDGGASAYDLSVVVEPSGEALDVAWIYSRDLFDPPTIARMAEGFARMLAAAAARPEAPIAALPLLSDDERRRVVVTWNETDRPYPLDVPVHRMFAAQAALAPDRIAVACAGEALTYGELARRAGAIAARLRRRGAGPGSIVGVLLTRSPDLVAALLGVLAAGAAYVPLDPTYPEARLRLMMHDAGARLLLSQPALADRLGAHGAEVIDLDAGDPGGPAPLEAPPAEDGALAYVLFTSGSTGRPRGAQIPHRALTNLLCAMRERPGLGPDDVLLAVTSVSFDIAALELFLPLVVGARVEIAPREIAADGRRLAEAIATSGATCVQATPATWQMLIDAGWQGDRRLTALCGGEALPRRLAEELARRAGSVWNMYGPTETTVWSLVHELSATDARIAIGRPIGNTRAYITDARMQPVPVGVAGELLLGGDGLSLGYLGLPALTAARFTPDPFSAVPGARVYRTGDRARHLPDGSIEYLGRADQQLKIRGHRVEPEEIEAALERHPAVRRAVVVAQADRRGDRRLVAYWVASPAAAPGAAEASRALRDHLGAALPAYMIPSLFLRLESLPLTPSGKVDRQALPREGELPGDACADRVPPADALEAQLLDLWAEILGADPGALGVTGTFFEAGGHSLKAFALVTAVRARYGAEVPLREVFAGLTVRGLAELVRRAPRRAGRPVVRVPERELYPVSAAQRRIYVLSAMDRGGTVYNVPGLFLCDGDLDPARVEAALRALVARHPALRTSFELRGGEVVQRVHREADLCLPVTHALAEDLPAIFRRFVRPFDLGTPPLARAELVKTPSGAALLVDVHHSVCDGRSVALLLEELAAVEAGEPLPPPGIGCGDYAVWERAALDAGELAADEAYWVERFRGPIPVLDLPADRPRPALGGGRGARLEARWPADLAAGLRDAAAAHGVTPFMLALAIYAVLLWRHTGQRDLVVGTPIEGRTQPGLERVVGMFVNTLPLRLRVDPGARFDELLAAVKRACLEAYEHQAFPFEMLVERLSLRRDVSRNPLFDTMLAYHAEGRPEIRVGGRRLVQAPADPGTAMFDLTCDLHAEGDEIRVVLEYNTDLFEADTIARMAGHLARLAAAAAASPAAPLSTLPMLSETEEAELRRLSGVEASLERALPLPALLEEQARRAPEAIAVRCGEAALTYAEVNRRANQLARRLRALGARPERVIGLMIGRRVEMIPAALAVSKAGAAWTPIDPAYPAARVRHLLEDSDAEVLLTSPDARPALSAAGFRGRVLDVTDPDLYQGDASDPAIPIDPASLAYVIYTSGTTGRPRGVEVEHGSLAHAAEIWRREYRLDAMDVRLLQVASFSFDVFAGDLARALVSGGELVICPEEVRLDLPRLYALLRDARVSIVESTPGLLIPLMEYVSRNRLPLDALRLLILGSDTLKVEDYRALLERFGGRMRIINSYGVTEATIDSSYYEAPASGVPASVSGAVPIGAPLPNTRFFILDPAGQPAPLGVVGELCIGGAGVARGYRGRPADTAARFTCDPSRPGRAYRTGDLARWRRDGTVELLGRADHQVKVRGFRIELGEIEARLLTSPGVRACVVVARPDRRGVQRLVAYLAGEPRAGEAEIAAHLREALPEFMVPGRVVWLDALPLTPNGKIDRAALPDPPEADGEGARADEPRTPLEAQLAALWRKVLGGAEPRRDESFFDLGGTSLHLLQVWSEIQATLCPEITVADLFVHHTLERLAHFLEGKQAPPARDPLDALLGALERGDIDVDRARSLLGKRSRGVRRVGR